MQIFWVPTSYNRIGIIRYTPPTYRSTVTCKQLEATADRINGRCMAADGTRIWIRQHRNGTITKISGPALSCIFRFPQHGRQQFSTVGISVLLTFATSRVLWKIALAELLYQMIGKLRYRLDKQVGSALRALDGRRQRPQATPCLM